MKIRILLSALLLSACFTSALAGTDRGGDEALRADVRELLEVTQAAKLGDQMVAQIFDMYEKLIPEVPKEVWRGLRKEFRGSDLVDLVAPIYEKHFTREDIRAITDFYRSPVGRKFVGKQGVLAKESMEIGMAWGKEIAGRVLGNVKSRGYKVPEGI
jgi:hypothetical protein